MIVIARRLQAARLRRCAASSLALRDACCGRFLRLRVSSALSRRLGGLPKVPIAIACLRLVTFLPERPLRNVPRLRSRMTFSIFFDAFLLYFLAMVLHPTTVSCGWSSTKRAKRSVKG